MKQNSIMHILMFIFRTPSIKNMHVSDLSKQLTPSLLQIGFDPRAISLAIRWLVDLTNSHQERFFQPSSALGTRIWSNEEYQCLGETGISYLTELYRTQILDDFSRELLIERLIALDEPSISLSTIKIVLMMILNLLPDHDHITQSFAGLLALEELSSEVVH